MLVFAILGTLRRVDLDEFPEALLRLKASFDRFVIMGDILMCITLHGCFYEFRFALVVLNA